MIEVFKWIREINKGSLDKVLILIRNPKTGNTGYKLDIFNITKEIGKNLFIKLQVDHWRKLHTYTVEGKMANSFKWRLDRYIDGEGR